MQKLSAKLPKKGWGAPRHLWKKRCPRRQPS